MSLVGKLVVVVRGPFEGIRGTIVDDEIGDDKIYVSILLTEKAFEMAERINEQTQASIRRGWTFTIAGKGLCVPRQDVEVIA